jgi:hypothetical protein
MNLHTFEKSHQGQSSFDEVADIKQKIEKRKEKQKKIKVLFIVLVALVVILGALFGYSQYRLYVLSKAEVVVTAQEGSVAVPSKPKTGEDVLTSLKRHILVPSGNPQIAEVQDVAKLKETQAFFKDAQNGDIVIVYETMIFIYRPGADIVVAASDISGVGQQKP